MQLATYILGAALISMCVATLPSDMEKNEILAKHNNFRQGEGISSVTDLTWNYDLAEMADLWATSCQWRYGQPDYSSPPYSYRLIAQNLHADSKYFSYSDAIQVWFDEKNNYNYTDNSCDGECRHYKKVVSAAIKEIGCSISNCQRGEHYYNYLVCNYGPLDIYKSERPYLKSICSTNERPHLNPKPYINEMGKDEILAKHNELRKGENALNMNDLTWNDKLAEMAHLWALDCKWEHGQPANYLSPPYTDIGQNLYATTGKKLSYSNAIQQWFNEKRDYNYYTNTCNEDRVCGHYTQVVWANTKEIGCSYNSCPNFLANKTALYFVCNYGPPGNYIGKKPYLKAKFSKNLKKNDDSEDSNEDYKEEKMAIL